MKKLIFLFSLSVLAFLSCYDMNTAPYPNLVGFHTVSGSSSIFVNEEVRGIAGHGKQAAAVSGSMIAYSEDDGVSWQAAEIVDSPPNLSLTCVAWGEGYYLAGGTGGSAAWSEDGRTWYAGVIGPMNPKNINAVVAGRLQNRKVFVAAGDDGRIAFAVDHPKGPWRMADLTPFGDVDGYGEDIFAAAWGYVGGNEKTGVFVVAGENGKIAFMRDLSGKWYGPSQAGTTHAFRSVAFGNDRFVAVGDTGIIKVCFDPATYMWERYEDKYIETRDLYAVVFDPAVKQFVAIGINSLIAYSSSGENWGVASFQNQDRISDDYGLSTAGCTGGRIILGCKDGLLLFSN
jgi:hypothetical protein